MRASIEQGKRLPERAEQAACLLDLRDLYGNLVDIAQARIQAGTVTETRHGWRVECRGEFDDNRHVARSYWPKEQEDGGWSCRCFQFTKSGGDVCSHIVAVLILEDRISRPEWGSTYGEVA